MTPVELNFLITAVTNYLYCTLSKQDFACLNVIISELGKSMFSTILLRDICNQNDKKNEKECKKELDKKKD